MLLYTDVISGKWLLCSFNSGDEMISDGFKIVEVDDIAYEVDCKVIIILL